MPTKNDVLDTLQQKINELKAQEEARKDDNQELSQSLKTITKAPSTSDIIEFKTMQNTDALSVNIGDNLVLVLIKNTSPSYSGLDGIVYAKDIQNNFNKEPESAFFISSELIPESQITSFLEAVAVTLFLRSDPSQMAHLLSGLNHQERTTSVQEIFPQNLNQLKPPVS